MTVSQPAAPAHCSSAAPLPQEQALLERAVQPQLAEGLFAVRALENFKIDGLLMTIPFHQSVPAHPDFAQGRVTTRWVEEQLLSQLYQPEAAA